MSASYAYLCRKAGIPAPGERVVRPIRAQRRRKMSVAEEKEILRAALAQMVATGELRVTPDGKYYLPTMKPYRIQNDIVAAHDEQEAIKVWSEQRGEPATAAGPVEQVPLTMEVMLEDESEKGTKPGTLADCFPAEGDEEARIIAFGDCANCP